MRTRVSRSVRALKVSGLELVRGTATHPGPKGTKAVRAPAACLNQPDFLILFFMEAVTLADLPPSDEPRRAGTPPAPQRHPHGRAACATPSCRSAPSRDLEVAVTCRRRRPKARVRLTRRRVRSPQWSRRALHGVGGTVATSEFVLRVTSGADHLPATSEIMVQCGSAPCRR
jgi:hypothetical protein